MKTCILGVFLKPRWYYGVFLLLVSVPLSGIGKEMEGLNVFATMSQMSVSWKDFPPVTIICSRRSHAVRLSTVPGVSVRLMRCPRLGYSVPAPRARQIHLTRRMTRGPVSPSKFSEL